MMVSFQLTIQHPSMQSGHLPLVAKNGQLIDTVDRAQASAIAYSIVETAKANSLKPYKYLKHLLNELTARLDEKSSDLSLDNLLPWSPDLPSICRKKSK